jgi:hypothetical protein
MPWISIMFNYMIHLKKYKKIFKDLTQQKILLIFIPQNQPNYSTPQINIKKILNSHN